MEARLEMPWLSELIAEMRAMPKILQTRIVKGAVATAAGVIREESVIQAPMWTGETADGHPPPGTLKKSIYQTRLVEKCTPTLEVWKVDVRRGKRTVTKGRGAKRVKVTTNDRDAFYAMWVERGHWTRTPGTTKRQHRAAVKAGVAGTMGARWVAPNPYMRRAWEAKKDDAARAMETYLKQQIELASLAMKMLKVK